MAGRHGRSSSDESDEAAGAATFPVVGVGASAGGLAAFSELLRNLTSDPGMALVLIQHLDPTHPSHLCDALARETSMPVHEIRDGMPIEVNHVYVIPSNADVGMLKGTLTLLPRPTEAGRPHLPIDFFFAALAADRATLAIGVVLSGTGSDGTEGLAAIKVEGGVTFVQDTKSAQFNGMPESAIKAGVADFELPIAELAGELRRVAKHPFLTRPDPEVLARPDRDFEKVLVVLRSAMGVDFSDYKLTSIRRRLARRMAVRRVTSLAAYVQLLRDEPPEIHALFEDLLIHVTSFFRDPDAFAALEQHVFPELLKKKRDGGVIRIWCAGCSTGEEAYSLVIALREFLAREDAADTPIQLFASDVSETAIEKARAGFYPDAAVRGVSAERLARHFVRVDGGGYRIIKAIRERCAFVKHDLASDPPFSKLDLVSCRNVLIYFGAELQQRVIATFHFALESPGFLLLGRSENIADDAKLFTQVDSEARIFARTATRSLVRLAPTRSAAAIIPPTAGEPIRRAPSLDHLVRHVESLLLDRYGPPGVIVTERMEIVRYRGRTSPFLEVPSGDPHHDLLKMARPGLLADLRIAVALAKQDGAVVRREGVRVEQNGSSRTCDVVVIPMVSPHDAHQPLFAVMFDEPRAAQVTAPGAARGDAVVVDDGRAGRIASELDATKTYLQSIIDEHQRTNDALMSANEELQSSNEELQSLNEELETAKEELQSTNEELSTLNEELETRNLELDAANGDLFNILGSVEVPIVIVDAHRRIRRFTPKARPILNLLPSDVGRPIDDIKPAIEIPDLDQKIADVIDSVTPFEEDVRGRNGQWYRLQVRPYMTVDRRIDGAVISVVDIDVLKRALGAAEWARDNAKATVAAVRIPLLVLDPRHEIVSTNQAFRDHFAIGAADVDGCSLYALLRGAWDHPEVHAAVTRVFSDDAPFEALELTRGFEALGTRTLSMSGRRIELPGAEHLALLGIEDVTERRRGEEERARLLAEAEAARTSALAANRAKDEFLAVLSHELRTPLSTLLLQAQLLLHTKMDDAKITRAGASIERAARAQAQLIDDLLDVSRIVAGKLRMEMQPVSLATSVRAATEVVAPSAERKHLTVELVVDDALPPVAGDPSRLEQVVLNLLTNAIKFTPEGGRVTVSVDRVGDRGRIRVSDTGVGIEASFLPAVFMRFSQEDRAITRSFGGLGLGLGIAHYVVEAHGGTISAESEGKGRGSTFTVELPLMHAASQATISGDHLDAGSLKDRRVLIVEDDLGTREALAQMLVLSGADIRAADSAAAGFAAVEDFRPEVIVCDLAMPDEDGYGFLRRVRALGPGRGGDVPVLALTALAGDEHRQRALEAGFQMHMAKPVDLDRLVKALVGLSRWHGGGRPPIPA